MGGVQGWVRRKGGEGLGEVTAELTCLPPLILLPHYVTPSPSPSSPAGSMLEFFSEAGQSTTAFGIDKPNLIVTSIAIDLDGNVWTGHMKVWITGMGCVGYGPHHVYTV